MTDTKWPGGTEALGSLAPEPTHWLTQEKGKTWKVSRLHVEGPRATSNLWGNQA